MQTTSHDSTHSKGLWTRVIVCLYLGFFAMWCVGLAVGEMWSGPEQPLWLGFPLWFLIGCLVSFVLVSIALIFCVRRSFI